MVNDRDGNNDKELSVKSGEFLEILDDRRNWWRVRNYYGLVGHVPHTILQPYDLDVTQRENPEKIGYF